MSLSHPCIALFPINPVITAQHATEGQGHDSNAGCSSKTLFSLGKKTLMSLDIC